MKTLSEENDPGEGNELENGGDIVVAPAIVEEGSSPAEPRYKRDLPLVDGGRVNVLTASQAHCVRQACKLAGIYFDGLIDGAAANLLTVGPTGCGKSAMLDRIAESLKIPCLRLTRATCIPLGAAEARPTLVNLLEAFLDHDRVLLHIDELDKFFDAAADSTWERSNLDMLWNLLDRRVSAETVAQAFVKKGPSKRGLDCQALAQIFREGLQRKLFIVGSGTWQHLQSRRRVGFPVGVGEDVKAPIDLRATKAIPDEILRRFYNEIVFLEYPTPAELESILRSAGIFDLAGQLGETLDPAGFDLSGVGLAAVRDLRTRLLMRLHGQDEQTPCGLRA